MVSIFLHECGHGLANAISGIPCSTGFNRVGDIYKIPSDPTFRQAYSQVGCVLLDFGVPCTLVLAVVGIILYRRKSDKVRYLGAAIASTNSILRLIPCLLVVLMPLITGKTHNEDEYETGLLLTQMTGHGFLLYVPTLFSIVVSVVCLILLIIKAKKNGIAHIGKYALPVCMAFCLGLVIANILDNIIRINWVAF